MRGSGAYICASEVGGTAAEGPGGVIADGPAPIEGNRYQPTGAAIKVCCTPVALAHGAWHLPRLPASTAA